jgi:peptide/nickel transport system substrate-binding protein
MNPMKVFRSIGLLVLISMLFAACAPAAVPVTGASQPAAPTLPASAAPAGASAPAAAPAATEASQPAASASTGPLYLNVSMEQQSTWVRNFNPFSPDTRMNSNTMMYEPLMVYNKTVGKLVPWLATEYAWNSDNTVLTFKLRPDVKWSDGQAFSAKDVVFTFDLVKKFPALVTGLGNVMQDTIESVTAPDESSIAFKFKVVNTPVLYVLANQFIVPEHIWKDVSDPVTFTNEKPVATGPFTEVTKFEDQIYVVEKNPYYWMPGKPAFQGLRFPACPGNDQCNMMLVNDELDWTGNFIPDIEKTYVSKNPENFHYYFVGGDAVMLYINPALKPFDKPEVRKAISMGIDRKMMVNVAMYDYIGPSDATGLSDEYKDWKNPKAVEAGSTWINYDPKAANDLLDKAGLKRGADGLRIGPDGKTMTYKLIVPNGWTDWISDCQIIAQNMKDLGITINIETPEQNSWQEVVFAGKHEWSLGWPSGGATPYGFYRSQMSKGTAQPVGETAGENWDRYVSADADKLLDEFAKTSDLAKQKEIMNEIQMVFVNEAPALPLYPQIDWYEYNTARFSGWPSKDNPYAPGTPFAAPVNMESPLLVVTGITPK